MSTVLQPQRLKRIPLTENIASFLFQFELPSMSVHKRYYQQSPFRYPSSFLLCIEIM